MRPMGGDDDGDETKMVVGGQAMSTKAITGVRAVTDKSGRTRLQPTKPKVSVSKAIAMRKGKKQKVVSRERGDSVRSTVSQRRTILDEDGLVVTAGCVIHFGYGIPPVGVDAKVVDRDGVLIALTPGHKPAECRVDQLAKHVGNFWVKQR